MESYDVIIIGAGPAGLSAALYALRGNLKTLILENDTPGGKVVKTSEITNWPGIIQVDGPTLAYNMYEQVLSLNAVYKYGRVIKIQNRKKDKIVYTDDSKYKTKAVIIATGTVYKKIGLENEDKYYGRGISYCAVCDAKLYQGKNIAVLGGGDSALKEAIYLSNFANEVVLIHRRDSFRASPNLIDKMIKIPNILCKTPYVIKKITGKEAIEGITIENPDTKDQLYLSIDGLFPCIGSTPATDFVQALGILNEQGYVLVNEHMETTIPGIYAAGDVIAKELRQIVTACNDGAIAAQHIVENLKI